MRADLFESFSSFPSVSAFDQLAANPFARNKAGPSNAKSINALKSTSFMQKVDAAENEVSARRSTLFYPSDAVFQLVISYSLVPVHSKSTERASRKT